jgi:hypothetical protein
VALGGWQLKHVVGGQETAYKFHRSLHIKPQQTITVSVTVTDILINWYHNFVGSVQLLQ